MGLSCPSSSGGLSRDVQYFADTGTWTKPVAADDAATVRVILVGGGGGAASGPKSPAGAFDSGGGGGAPGIANDFTFLASQLGATEAVTIGAGGAGGAAVTVNSTAANPGIAGGTSYFGGNSEATCKLMAQGGSPGTYSGLGIGGKGLALVANTGGVKETRVLYSVSGSGGDSDTNTGIFPGNNGGIGPSGGAGGGIGHPIASAGAANPVTVYGLARSNNVTPNTNGGAINGGAVPATPTPTTNGTSIDMFGHGGAGSGGSTLSNAVAGGAGSAPGGGGGGGGCGLDAVGNSGAGGAGAKGGCYVITYY